MTRWLTTLGVYAAAFVVAGSLATACNDGFEESLASRCDPSDPSSCSSSEFTPGSVCCSDDPAAMDPDDPDALVLPGYLGNDETGTPLFSGANNHRGSSGLCIHPGSAPPANAIGDPGSGQGCPLPCNPTWASSDIEAVCGPSTICCQTVEIGPNDCSLDPDLGDDGCWRPVTGGDMADWADHDTPQDPDGIGCEAFVTAQSGDPNMLSACFRRLSVADQRGFCLGGSPNFCPFAVPSYRDACEQRNDEEARTGCD